MTRTELVKKCFRESCLSGATDPGQDFAERLLAAGQRAILRELRSVAGMALDAL